MVFHQHKDYQFICTSLIFFAAFWTNNHVQYHPLPLSRLSQLVTFSIVFLFISRYFCSCQFFFFCSFSSFSHCFSCSVTFSGFFFLPFYDFFSFSVLAFSSVCDFRSLYAASSVIQIVFFCLKTFLFFQSY